MTKFYNIDTSTNLGGTNSSDSIVSSQKSIKTYVDTCLQSTINVQSDWNETNTLSDSFIKNKPTIGEGVLSIFKNDSLQGTFSANETTSKSITISVPTKTSQLSNDSGFLTQHQDISGKQDTLVSGTNIKTINGYSVLGSGNLTIETSSVYECVFTFTALAGVANPVFPNDYTLSCDKTIPQIYTACGNGKLIQGVVDLPLHSGLAYNTVAYFGSVGFKNISSQNEYVAEFYVTSQSLYDEKLKLMFYGITSSQLGGTWTVVDINELPSQSGNSGKVLSTDGSNPYWTTVETSNIVIRNWIYE